MLTNQNGLEHIGRRGVLKTGFSNIEKRGFQKKKMVGSFHHTWVLIIIFICQKENKSLGGKITQTADASTWSFLLKTINCTELERKVI